MSYVLRPATLADAPAVTDLLNAIDLIEIGRPETDLHTVEADLKHPATDLAQDSWLAFDGDRLVVYGLLWDESGGERIDVDHYVLPEHQEAGRLVLEAMEARALRKARENGAGQAVVHLHLNVRPTLDTDVIRERGWSVVRRYHVLRRSLDRASDLAPDLPEGVRVRSCAGEADRVRVYELYQASFAEHFDFQPRGYEQWLHDVDAAGLDWSLVWIVGTDDLGDAGSCWRATTARPWGGSAASASCARPGGAASPGSCYGTPSRPSPRGDATWWGWAWTPRTPRGLPSSTRATG